MNGLASIGMSRIRENVFIRASSSNYLGMFAYVPKIRNSKTRSSLQNKIPGEPS